MVRLDLHGGHVDNRVFPDLRIDKAPEGQTENPFQNAVKAQHPVPVYRMANKISAARGFHDRVECHCESFHDQPVKI
jgi:hypothetical protein